MAYGYIKGPYYKTGPYYQEGMYSNATVVTSSSVNFTAENGEYYYIPDQTSIGSILIKDYGYVSNEGTISAGTVENTGTLLMYFVGSAKDITVESGGWIGLVIDTIHSYNITDGDSLSISASSETDPQEALDFSYEYGSNQVSDLLIPSFAGLTVEAENVFSVENISVKGRLELSGCSVENINVLSGGGMLVRTGTEVCNLTVENGGEVFIRNNGDNSYADFTGELRLGGSLHMHSYDEDSLSSAAVCETLIFDLTDRTPDDNSVMVDYLSSLDCDTFAVSVSTDQEEGVYRLAGSASEFQNSISVSCSDNVLGTVSLAQTLEVGDSTYSLFLNNSSLYFSIQKAPDVPQIISSGTKSIAWTAVSGTKGYWVQYSTDNFVHSLTVFTNRTELENCGLPKGEWKWRVRTDESQNWQLTGNISKTKVHTTPSPVAAQQNEIGDIFFLTSQGIWNGGYGAEHVGCGSWLGTGETASISGKNIFSDTITGNDDPNLLVLTDDSNGDALFLDDIYTAFPESGLYPGPCARISQINEIRAGAGNDVVDLTSRQFDFMGDVTIRGGDGDDVIWSNCGSNDLFGDAGNDRLVGAFIDDLLVGGIGNDSMHGGGGDDIFAFCDNWGKDTVEQLPDGTVTLWFKSGSIGNWNADTLTYTDGNNSVTVSGISAENVILKFGESDDPEMFAKLTERGAFADFSSEKIFEKDGKGILAVL